MRLLITALLALSALGTFAQPGGCGPFDFCFAPSVLPSGNSFFDNCSSGPASTQYVWTYGDGASSSSEHGEHQYAAPGIYEVCLTAYWENCSDSTCTLITVGNPTPCSNNFHVELAWNAGGGGSVFFNATSTFPQTNFIWYFGDGSEGYGAATEHTYDGSGTYGVCVSGWYWNEATGDTCWVEDCEQVVVEGSGPCGGLEACFVSSELANNGFFFDNCSTVGGQFEWSYGDGTGGNSVNGEHHYAQPGTYTVCLSAIWGDCDRTTCTTIVVEDQVCGNLMANFGSVVTGNHVQFDNASSGTGPTTTYSWAFGDGGTSSEEYPDHTYATSGSYEVCLTVFTIVFDPNGQAITCQDTYCTSVIAFGATSCGTLNASFTVNPSPLDVVFINTTTGVGSNTSYFWDFGDGTTGTFTSGGHVYPGLGTYTACLLVTSTYTGVNGGTITCTDEQCMEVVIGGSGPCSSDFDVEMAWNAGADGNVYFIATSNIAGTNFIWYYGDNTEGAGPTTEHHYAQDGSYYACVSGWYYNESTQDTCWTEDCELITVGNVEPCAELEACFEASQLSSTGFFFDNCSSPSLNSTFVWLFNDGTTSTEFSPIHTFAEAGFYNVCLITTWPNGCIDEACSVLAVGEDPCTGLEACFVTNDLPQPGAFFFDNCSQAPNGTQMVWDFGDGAGSTVTNAEHVYQANGTYTVCLNAYYGNCSDSTCVDVVVSDAGGFCDDLVACFEPQPFENGAYLFENCSQLLPIDIPAYYLWDLGDGSTSDNTQPDHVFAPGTYTVCLTVTHGDCIDETCTTITVIGPGDPCANFNAGFTTFLSPNGIQFSNTTSGTGFQTTFAWTFGDGGSSNDPQPFHTYQLPGTYNVCLVATSIYEGQNGGLITCVDEFCMMVTANGAGEGCDPDYTASFTYQVQNNTVIFVANFITPTLGVVWTFPDGSQAYEPIHTQLFVPPGPYEVCLSTWYWNELTQDTCWATSCQLVNPFTTGIPDIGTEGINVFPVPASDVLTVSGLSAGATLRMFAADGRLVLTERTTATTHQVHVAGLASGAYVLRIDAGERAMYKRVVVE